MEIAAKSNMWRRVRAVMLVAVHVVVPLLVIAASRNAVASLASSPSSTSTTRRVLDVVWDTQENGIDPLIVNTGDVVVFHYSAPMSVIQVPTWEAALSCHRSNYNDILAGPSDGEGEGFKYTVPSVGASYFISMPTPCPVASFHDTSGGTRGMCCQKMATVSVERGENELDLVLHGTKTKYALSCACTYTFICHGGHGNPKAVCALCVL